MMAIIQRFKRVARVKRLAENTQLIDDIDVIPLIDRADVEIEVGTNNFAWTVNDKQWQAVIKASDYLAAAEILSNSADNETREVSIKYRKNAYDIIKALNNKSDVQGRPVVEVTEGINSYDQRGTFS